MDYEFKNNWHISTLLISTLKTFSFQLENQFFSLEHRAILAGAFHAVGGLATAGKAGADAAAHVFLH